eukprot:CAMPEP_0194328538 /NCGR_PEP_ID=MMETSP0171-20130528/45225_1 /TAXON_ID=218684 /ORGANISM="Corethron pennatum, Strain L29A3" /LENGTH=110 /DNA_ID=CAMNT_0039088937 /DNA_START=234 /DNA_END=564 /DNA_ORIENTATION=-
MKKAYHKQKEKSGHSVSKLRKELNSLGDNKYDIEIRLIFRGGKIGERPDRVYEADAAEIWRADDYAELVALYRNRAFDVEEERRYRGAGAGRAQQAEELGAGRVQYGAED